MARTKETAAPAAAPEPVPAVPHELPAPPPHVEPTNVVLIEAADGPQEHVVNGFLHPRAHTITLDGQVHHHVADAPDGRWIYRRHDA